MIRIPKILVVDDHEEIRVSIQKYLRRQKMIVEVASDAVEMDGILSGSDFDLILLDVMMPGEDGFSICKRISKERETPILMLTALDSDNELLKGFATGADDYLSKPFNPKELLARIHAILRRSALPSRVTATASELSGLIKFAGLQFDIDARVITKPDGKSVVLTTSEAKILIFLASRPRVPFDREKLLELSTGRQAGPLDRTIDNQISRLRRKIEPDVLRPRIISTIRNEGYALACNVERLP